MGHINKKLVKGQLWAEVTDVMIWHHMKFLSQYTMSHMRPFLFGYHISFCYFFALEVVRGHEFLTHLKMCVVTSDLLPLIWNNQKVSDKMGS